MLAAGTQHGARGGADTGTPWNRSLSQSDLVDQPSDISIRAERFDSADARRLIAALDASLSELYPPEQRFGPNLKAEHLEDGHGSFFVAREGERAIGCGAVRLLDSATAEAKRMYVESGYRGKGIGARVRACTSKPRSASIAAQALSRSTAAVSTLPRPPACASRRSSSAAGSAREALDR